EWERESDRGAGIDERRIGDRALRCRLAAARSCRARGGQARRAAAHRRWPRRRRIVARQATIPLCSRHVAFARSSVRNSGARSRMTIPIIRRAVPSNVAALLGAGIPSVLARVYAARGIESVSELEHGLDALPSFASLANIDAAVDRLSYAIATRESIVIVADYD